METNDILERTLAQEKSRYEKFCRIMYGISTVMTIFFLLAAVFCLIVTIVQEIQYKNNGGETDILATVISALYVTLVLGGIGNIRGSVIAAMLLYLLPEMMRGLNRYRMLIYAIVLILMMLFNWAPASLDMRSRMREKLFSKRRSENREEGEQDGNS